MIRSALLSFAALTLGLGICRAVPTPAGMQGAPQLTREASRLEVAAAVETDEPAAQGRVDPQRIPGAPAEPRALGGLAGLVAKSELHFAGREDDPYLLDVTYLFPGRARWARTRQKTHVTTLEFRYGENFYSREKSLSRKLDPIESQWTLRSMELRRAAMLWPQGFEWNQKEGAARAILPDDPGDLTVGYLSAELEDGRPARLSVFNGQGLPQERLVIDSWTERHGRAWPAQMRLFTADRLVWTETLQTIDVKLNYPDHYFLPIDVAADGSVPEDEFQDLRHATLDGFAFHGFPLEAREWTAALAEGERLAGAERRAMAERGVDCLADLFMELDEDGAPTTALLVAPIGHMVEMPDGWYGVPSRTYMGMTVSRLERIDADLMAELRSRVPLGSQGETPFVTAYGGSWEGKVGLYVPLTAAPR